MAGSEPRAEKLSKIAKFLCVDAEWLLNGEIPLQPRHSHLKGGPNSSALPTDWNFLKSLQKDPAAWRDAYDQIVTEAGVDLFQITKATDNLIRRARVALPELAKINPGKSRDLEDAIAKVESVTADANNFSNLFEVLGELLYAIPAWLDTLNQEKGSR